MVVFTSRRSVSNDHLGLLEQYSTVRSHLGIYLNVGVTATYWKQSREAVKPALFRALAVVILKHPILSAVPIHTHTMSPRFVQLSQISLQNTVTFIQASDYCQPPATGHCLDELLEEQHNRPFTHETPLSPFWRLLVAEDTTETSRFTVSFIFHHCLADTQSALVFHEDLEDALSNPSLNPSIEVVSITILDLLPPLENLLELSLSYKFLDRQRTYRTPSPDTWTAAPQSVPVKSRFTSLWLPSATTQNLQRMAKNERSSMTAMLQSLLAASIFHILPLSYTTLTADCAVSLRRWLQHPINKSSIGCYVGSFSQTYTRSSFSWDEARKTKITIDKVMDNPGADMSVGYLRCVPDMHQWFGRKMGQQRLSAFELSNVGTMTPSTKHGNYQIQSMLFSQSASACSGAIKVSAVTGRDGRLALRVSWQVGVVNDDMIQGLVAQVLEEVENLVATC